MGRRSRGAQDPGCRVKKKKEHRPATRLVEGGRRREWTQGIVNPPVWRASTILFDSIAEMKAARPEDGVLHYGRDGTPTTWALAEALTLLEPGAAGTRLYPSGVAAVACALMSVLESGDELLMIDSVYGPTRAFCDATLSKLGIATRYYDPLVGADIAGLFTPKSRAVFMESPGSLTFEVQDVPAICAAAKACGITTLLDNTWATPLLFPALAVGVDLAIMACTKYVIGHADAMLGSVTAAPSHWDALVATSRAFGQQASPDDAFLGSRGLRTLGVRLKQHEATGLAVARWLGGRPEVARLLHPAFADCPGHDIWARDFAGSNGLFAFVLKGGSDADRAAFIDRLDLFGIGYSWGGYESLAVPVDPARLRTATPWEAEGPLVRLHVGLEDPEDLIADLAAALASHPKG